MEYLFCKCLNVIIHVQGKEVCTGHELSLINEFTKESLEKHDQFFGGKLWDIQNGLSGIQLALRALLKERQVGDWCVTTCINCRMDTHAIRSIIGSEKVLASHELLHDSKWMLELKRSPMYSDAFKIVLLKQQDTATCSPAAYMHNKFVVDSVSLIESLVQRYLSIKESDLSEQIRIFTEQQLAAFDRLKLKASNDKEQVLQILSAISSSLEPDSLEDDLVDSYFGSTSENKQGKTGAELPRFRTSESITVASRKGGRFTDPVSQTRLAGIVKGSSHVASAKVMGNIKVVDEEDELFDLEGFQESAACEPFYDSDGESSGGATSLDSSGGYHLPIRTVVSDRIYAASVPVGIPFLERSKRGSDGSYVADNEEPTPPPEHMADSIRALAQSLQDSTSMFGELPRPRLNTLPFSYR